MKASRLSAIRRTENRAPTAQEIQDIDASLPAAADIDIFKKDENGEHVITAEMFAHTRIDAKTEKIAPILENIANEWQNAESPDENGQEYRDIIGQDQNGVQKDILIIGTGDTPRRAGLFGKDGKRPFHSGNFKETRTQKAKAQQEARQKKQEEKRARKAAARQTAEAAAAQAPAPTAPPTGTPAEEAARAQQLAEAARNLPEPGQPAAVAPPAESEDESVAGGTLDEDSEGEGEEGR